ncbi:MAG: ATP-binding cassette domain-containing protein, partial [Mycoplasma sp.]
MFFNDKKSEEVKLVERLNKPHKGPKKIYVPDSELIVDAKNVEKSYISGSIISKILKNDSIQIKKGEFVVILGPSGSGKTTLMNIISGLDRATDGEVDVVGNCLINLNDDELTKFRRINVGYIFQQYGLIPNLKVKENIMIGSYLNGLNKKELEKNKKHDLEIVNEICRAEMAELLKGKSFFNHLDECSKNMKFNDYIFMNNNYFSNDDKDNLIRNTFGQNSVEHKIISLKIKTKLWIKSIE